MDYRQSENYKKLVLGAREFYFNEDHNLHLTDYDWDNLLAEAKKNLGNDFSIFDVITENGKTIRHLNKFPSARKRKMNEVSDVANLDKSVTVISPKMDGCSVVAYYYPDGRLHYICSRSNDVNGKDKTNYFKNYFPSKLDTKYLNSGMSTQIMCEHVIGLHHGFGWNSRQKANGLTNSKYKHAEVAAYSTFIIYDAIQFNNDGDQRRVELGNIAEACGCGKVIDLCKFIRFWNNLVSDSYLSNYKDIDRVLCRPKRENLRTMPADSYNYLVYEYGDLVNLFPMIKSNDGQKYLFSMDTIFPRLSPANEFPLSEYSKHIDRAHYHHEFDPDLPRVDYLIDGVVDHNYLNDLPNHNIFKYNYNESKVVTVSKISWNESQYNNFIPVITFEPVLIEGSWISRASIGGLGAYLHNELGPGATVEVARINSTIPQVVNIISKAEPTLPVCPHCGTQMTKDDIIAGMLRCRNNDCIGKIKSRGWFVDDENITMDDFRNNFTKYMSRLVNIDRYNKSRNTDPSTMDEIINSALQGDYDNFVKLSRENIFVGMTDIQITGFEYGIPIAYEAIKLKFNL